VSAVRAVGFDPGGRGVDVRAIVVLLAAAASAPMSAHAEASRPARQVVKCEIAGETVYTDLSCAEAHRIAVELSPDYRARQSLRREASAEASAASGPANPGEPSTAAHHVIALSLPSISPALGRNAECPHLEQRMALVEAEGRIATASDALQHIEQRLAVQRSWHRELGC